jgi:tetratricopeptide (TPR) repeat protein
MAQPPKLTSDTSPIAPVSENSSERNPIDVLAEEFAARVRQGANPSIEEYAAKYPHLADDIRNLFPPVAMMEELKRRRSTRIQPETPKIEQLGDFKVVRELGRGGMGIVYEAQQTTLNRRVALKVLPRHSLLDASRLQRFKREAQAAAQLHHTNIVPVFGNGEIDGLHYYVMQYIEGVPLNTLLEGMRGKTTLPASVPQPDSGTAYWRWVANVGVQIADALHYAHRQGILHRDIKPGNILLDLRGAAWITDFGLAKVTATQDDLTQTGDLVGTLQYMAPEAFDGPADTRSDIYSLSLTMIELLTLHAPFSNMTPTRLLTERPVADPIRPRKLNPAIPRDLENVLLKASALAPEQRYQNAADFADDLRRFIDDRPVIARAAGPIERLVRWCRRNRVVAVLIGAVAVSLILALVTGWVGYVKTTEALERESQRRIEADNAKRKADENVKICVEAFEKVFNELEPDEERAGGLPPPLDHARRPDDPNGPPPEQAAKELAVLQSVLNFYNQFAEKNATDTNLQFYALRANGHIVDILERLGEFNKAEESCQKTIKTASEFHDKDPKNPEYTLLLARLYEHLASAEQRRGQFADAHKNLENAMALHRQLAQQQPEVLRHEVDAAHMRLMIAELYVRQKKFKEARSLIDESLAQLQTIRQPDNHVRGITGEHYRMLALILIGTGDQEGARKALQDAEPYGKGPKPRNRPPPPPPRDDFPPNQMGPPPDDR